MNKLAVNLHEVPATCEESASKVELQDIRVGRHQHEAKVFVVLGNIDINGS